MSTMKYKDFREALKISGITASSLLNTSGESIPVRVLDEDGNIYEITDVKFNTVAGCIVIEFDHDNDE